MRELLVVIKVAFVWVVVGCLRRQFKAFLNEKAISCLFLLVIYLLFYCFCYYVTIFLFCFYLF